MSAGSVSVAIYARVSSEQQAEAGTTASQLEALRQRVKQDGYEVTPDLSFVDEGYSGATLIRPSLEQLRDAVSAGLIDRVYVHSPDRLARKYAYQVLLIEEFQRCRTEVVFLNHAFGETAEENLLLQVQGMVAEYERAKILERSRRGKLHSAKSGSIAVMSGAPYGYRYISARQTGAAASWEIVLEEAKVVRQIFAWIGEQRLSAQQVCRRLDQLRIPTSKGNPRWNPRTICGIIRNPAYIGRAAYGKTHIGERRDRLRPIRGSSEQSKRAYSIYEVPQDQWIRISVPPIVGRELFETVQEQLADNRKRYRLRREGPNHLLQGLIVCKRCGYSYCCKYTWKRSSSAGGKARLYVYYRCTGTGRHDADGQRMCSNRALRADLLDQAVWEDVCSLLSDPQRIQQEYQRRLTGMEQREGWDSPDRLRSTLRKMHRGIDRMIDAYADGLLTKEEFEPRIQKAKQRLSNLEQEQRDQADEQLQRTNLKVIIGCMQEFAEKIQNGLGTLEWDAKRKIICAIVKQIEVDEQEVRIVYRVRPNNFTQGSKQASLPHCSRRVYQGHRPNPVYQPRLSGRVFPSLQLQGLPALPHRQMVVTFPKVPCRATPI